MSVPHASSSPSPYSSGFDSAPAPAPAPAPVPVPGFDLDYDGRPVLVEPEIRRLDGVAREASVPPLVAPVTRGSLADLPFDNADSAPRQVVLSRKGPDGRWTEVTAAEFAAQVLAVA